MPTTCKVRFATISVLLLGLSATAQSLEERLSQARRSQASQLSEEQADSLLNARRGRNALPTAARKPRAGGLGQGTLDSLISGPGDSLFSGGGQSDSGFLRDSLPDSTRRAPAARAPLPKRYEQRIFRGADRSAFTGTSGAAGRNYVLGPGDGITVSLWGDKEKEYDLTLNAEGKIFLEGIGVVPLAGQNLDQAQAIVKQRLAKVYSGISRGTAHVDLSLGRAGPIRVFALGEVMVPGSYVFTGHTSVLSALYFARGPTDIGTVRNLTLTRSGVKSSLDLYDYLMKGESLKPGALQDGDILFAGRAEALVDIEGDVGRPARYELRKGEGVKELIAFAGGLNATAATQKLVLQRVFENGKIDFMDLPPPQEFLSGKAKVELRDGDKVMVRKSTEASREYLTISGPVKYPGTYESAGILSVRQLVEKAGGLREDAYLGRVHVVRFRPDGSSSLFAYSLDKTVTDSMGLEPRDNVILYSIKDMYQPDSLQISGAVFNPGKYEYRSGTTVKDLIMQAGGLLPHHDPGKIIVFRGDPRDRKTEQIALTEAEGMAKSRQDFVLTANDLVQVPVDPKWYVKEVVTLDGLFMHPGKYALLYPGEKIASVVRRAGGFKENGYVQGSRFFRTKDSVGRVGVDLAKAVSSPHSKANIPLVGGDSIYVPDRLNTVKVIGEVGFETSVLAREGATVQYYIEKAGGFTRRSEKDRVVVQYANGETSRDGYFNRSPDAGSVIYVPQGPEPKPTDWFAGINAILSTVGVALAVILSIQAIQQ